MQKQLKETLGVEIRAQPGFKRQSAERYIREFKTRTRVALDLAGKIGIKAQPLSTIIDKVFPAPPHHPSIISFRQISAGLVLGPHTCVGRYKCK